jgi:hypothetical protein
MILNPDGTLTCEHGNDVLNAGPSSELPDNMQKSMAAAFSAAGLSGAALEKAWAEYRASAGSTADHTIISPCALSVDDIEAAENEVFSRMASDACAHGTAELTPVSELLADRGATHGDFRSSSVTMQQFKRAARRSPNWENMSDMQREALDMILHKIGRVLHGDPRHKDHWDDIAGYATLVAQELD